MSSRTRSATNADPQRGGVVLGEGHDDRAAAIGRATVTITTSTQRRPGRRGRGGTWRTPPSPPPARRSARTCAGRRDRGRSGRCAGSRWAADPSTTGSRQLLARPAPLIGRSRRARRPRPRGARRARPGGSRSRPRGRFGPERVALGPRGRAARPAARHPPEPPLRLERADSRSSRRVTGSASALADRRGPLARGGGHRRPRRRAASTGSPITSSVTSCSRHTRPSASASASSVAPRLTVDSGRAMPIPASATASPIRFDPRSTPRMRRHAARPGRRRQACGGRVVDGLEHQPDGSGSPVPRPCRTPRAARYPGRSRHRGSSVAVGAVVGRGLGVGLPASGSTAGATTTVTRPSIVGTLVTQPGHRTMATSPYVASAASASAFDRPSTSRSSAAASSGRTCFALPSTGNVDDAADDAPLADVDRRAAVDELAALGDRVLEPLGGDRLDRRRVDRLGAAGTATATA